MPNTKNVSHSAHSPEGPEKAGAGSPADLDACPEKGRRATRKSRIDATQGNARGLAAGILDALLDEPVQERLIFTSSAGSKSGPAEDSSEGMPVYRIALPPEGPDSDMPVSPGYVVSAMLQASLDALGAERYIMGLASSPADPYDDLAASVRFLVDTDRANVAAAGVEFKAFGLPIDDFEAAVLEAANARILSGAVPHLDRGRDSLDALLLTLELRKAMAEDGWFEPSASPSGMENRTAD